MFIIFGRCRFDHISMEQSEMHPFRQLLDHSWSLKSCIRWDCLHMLASTAYNSKYIHIHILNRFTHKTHKVFTNKLRRKKTSFVNWIAHYFEYCRHFHTTITQQLEKYICITTRNHSLFNVIHVKKNADKVHLYILVAFKLDSIHMHV